MTTLSTAARLLTGLLYLMQPAWADDIVPFNFSAPGTNNYTTSCSFGTLEIPDDTLIYAAGAYSGRKLSVQIDQSGHQATQIDVAVNTPNKPVILLLGAYEPTIWRVGWSQNTDIIAVLVSGYHRQAIAGLSDDTPIINSSHEDKGPCPYFYIGGDGASKINPLSRRLFGRPVDRAFRAVNGNVVVGQPLSRSVKLVTSKAVPIESFIDKDAPMAGEAGLQQAVQKGILRPMSRRDGIAWIRAKQKSGTLDIPPFDDVDEIPVPLPHTFNAYMVLKDFRIPAGLYGGHSAAFYVPESNPKITGNPGHSTFCYFDSGECSGPGTGMMANRRIPIKPVGQH